jgi:hypothetical protein
VTRTARFAGYAAAGMFLAAWGLFAYLLVGRVTAALLTFFDASPQWLTSGWTFPAFVLILSAYAVALVAPCCGLLGLLWLVHVLHVGRPPATHHVFDLEGE